MKLATIYVEFSFDGSMYRQTDIVSMGSSSRSALANIFVCFNEKSLLSGPEKLEVYFRNVDEIFCLF